MAQEMDKHVFALASARHIKYCRTSMPLNYAKQKSDLELLDYIALLLVTESAGDVAAVAMEQLSNGVTFFYSKNAPCSNKFGEYLRRLTTICASFDRETFIGLFLTEVFNNCANKIKSRLDKCQKAIKQLDTIQLDAKDAAQVPKCAIVQKSWRGKTFGEICEDFLKRLGSYNVQPHRGGSLHSTQDLCMEAFYIGKEPGLLRYPTLAGRIKKFGDYYGATRRIRALLSDDKFSKLRGSISIREIRPPQPRNVEVTRNVVQILNNLAGELGYDEITAADYTKEFELPVYEDGETQKITVSSHCELTLALHFYEKMTRSKDFMEMGVSKGCCWLCEQFLETLSRQEKKLVVEVSHNQGKIHAGWGMPDKTPSTVAEKMLQIIDQRLCNIQATIRSNSVFADSEEQLIRCLELLEEA
jgi:hypothetical protein